MTWEGIQESKQINKSLTIMKRGKHSDLRPKQGNNHYSYSALKTQLLKGDLWKLILDVADELNSRSWLHPGNRKWQYSGLKGNVTFGLEEKGVIVQTVSTPLS